MYEKSQKVSEYGLNQINKGILLLVPKPITVGEGIPTPNDISWGSPQHNKLKY